MPPELPAEVPEAADFQLFFSPSGVVRPDPNGTQTDHTSEVLPYLTPAQATSRSVKRLAPYIESAIVERKVALGIPLSTPEVQSLGTEADNLRRVPLYSSDERIQTRKREYFEWRPHLDPPEPRPYQYRATLRGPEGPISFFSNWTLQKKHPLKGKMDDYGSDTDSDYTTYWRDWFMSSRGNEYFCEIDEEYLTDRFNLTGLNADVQYYQYALDLVTDVFDLDCDDDMREQIEKSARHLYGLVHARYITTIRGLAKMLDKYKKADFGRCPRVMCGSQPLLPTGMSDVPNVQSVKLFCGKCEDLYNPKSSRHASIDGAYFGTSFQNILYQVHPTLIPQKTIERYQPRVFGFKVHAAAALERWQSVQREEMQKRLKNVGVWNVFKEDYEVDDELEEDPDDMIGVDMQAEQL